MASKRRISYLLAAGALLSACNPVEWARQQLLNLDEPANKPQAAPSADADGLVSAAALRAKANGELMGEMLHVIFVRPPQDRALFGSLVDSLNQGASLEGIYNGLTHSSDYRKLEMANPGSSGPALQVFAELLVELGRALPSATAFSASAARPLAMPVQPGSARESDTGVNLVDFGKKARVPASPAPLTGAEAIAAYKAQFQSASIFTLKRVLGDEALKVFEHLRRDPAALAAWYGKWVVSMSRYEVDFGLNSRNTADETLHAKWAEEAPADRLVWEVLNRTHRILNDAQKKK